LLEDTDGDGTPDTNTIYAQDLAWPSALACSAGGVYVAATPEIIYLKDTQPGGPADLRKVVLNGFGAEGAPLKVDSLLNSFTWGLDNRIHVGTAGLGGLINALRAPGGAPTELAQHDFSFDPIGLTIMPESGPAESGLTFDSRGRRFLSDFGRPLRQAIIETRYLARNPFLAKPNAVVNITGASAPIFRIFSGTEPNRPPAADRPVPPTRARGCVIYRGGVFPASYAENLFFADSAAGVVHHAVLREQGLGWVAERASDEINTEFLVCRDPAFQPVQVVAGPDGGLYIVDLHGGGDKGRIFRILPEKVRPSKYPQLGKSQNVRPCGRAGTHEWLDSRYCRAAPVRTARNGGRSVADEHV
jgi:putative membrane-bound dehydrogenase-like protein